MVEKMHKFTISTLVLDKGEWSASRPGLLTLEERAPGAH
jgi:hypothetical protein